MFVYVTDINNTTWAINAQKIIKIVEAGKTTLIYFETGDILKANVPMLELVPRLNNV